jgi:hypothetical protein
MRIRLKAPCFFNNHLCEAGEIIDLPEGMEGPHRARAVSLDRIDYDPKNGLDANRILGEIAMEPLFDVIDGPKKTDGEIEKAVKPPPAPAVTFVGPKTEEPAGK